MPRVWFPKCAFCGSNRCFMCSVCGEYTCTSCITMVADDQCQHQYNPEVQAGDWHTPLVR